MEDCEDRRLLILYGSQTGTAQDVAEQIGRDSKRRYFKPVMLPMDDYNISELIKEVAAVFVCSTTGQGVEPDNMKKFWKFLLRRNLPNDSLRNLKFAVLGLGDSSYTKFNFTAKKLHKRLCQLGGTALIKLGLADDQHDLGSDAVVVPWIKELWTILLRIYPIPRGKSVIEANVLSEPKYNVIFVDTAVGKKNEVNAKKKDSQIGSNDGSVKRFNARIMENKRLTSPDHFQDVRLIKFDMSDLINNQYSPGDVLMVQPENLSENVEEFLKLLVGMPPETRFILRQNDPNVPLPSLLPLPCTIRQCVEKYWDIQSVPRKYVFELLSYFTKSELEKEKLIEFCSSEGQQDLFDYCNRPRRNIIEVLQDFPNAMENIPFEYLFDLIPGIKPRAFSIASSNVATPNEVHLLVALVEYKTRLHRIRQGLCSTWLSRKRVGDMASVWLRKGTMKFPDDNAQTQTVVLIGPGTGVAPFRSFIQERAAKNISKTFLFFGCRNQKKDFYFHEEWKEFKEKGLLHLFTAFSRDQEEKIYVQTRMVEQSKLIWNLISSGATLYIAGNAKQMPADVLETLSTITAKEGELEILAAHDFIANLEKKEKIQLETWS